MPPVTRANKDSMIKVQNSVSVKMDSMMMVAMKNVQSVFILVKLASIIATLASPVILQPIDS